MKRFAWLLAAALVTATAANPAQAQFFTSNPYYYQYGSNYGPGAGYLYSPYNSGYGYGYGPYYNPYSGNLYGSAAVIGASSQYMLSVQQARQMQQQVKQARLANRRAAFDEWLYERANTPTTEDLREQARLAELRRARNDPPITEVWSGQALNVLLKDLERAPAAGQAPMPNLSPDTLSHINVTGSRNDSSIGVLRNDGRLEWPAVLREPAFADDRKAVEALAQTAIKQARTGQVDADVTNGLKSMIDQMNAQLKQRVADIPSYQWIDGKRYLDQLQSAVQALQDPSAASYFNGRWSARGATIADLVRYMSQNGLRFAPATAGDEAAYQSLYRELADYSSAAGRRLVRTEAAPGRATGGGQTP